MVSNTKYKKFDQERITRLTVEIEILNLSASSWLRWPSTVFARAFADAIQHVHKDFKKQTCHQ